MKALVCFATAMGLFAGWLMVLADRTASDVALSILVIFIVIMLLSLVVDRGEQ